MFKPNSLIIYVEDVSLSTEFYKKILKSDPLETYEEFSVFPLASEFILGIQSKSGIDPKPQAQFGGFEICLSDVTPDAVDTIYQEWKKLGVKFELEPINLEFGYTFVAIDPDGHRLRVCATDTSNIS
ncbi:phenazine biosynthesis protein [Pectobacterium parmentieri]|uniref:Phenazine antibiotic resistance protein n=1 Tax=Pectobacterium parmentieri TaxID=1905730 RepID=A0A0H3I3T2_PECPM|nr:VOC family protein [Pectobacterium parmentieri]AFI90014.1 Lactoylglutathione lyase [Pectobacterium parmentieri]AOR59036.1 phenazine biosynthesis protein [Pectobacterium parmentieri]AYH01224.1 phenazine biosynthesis protein [Pectobacterium parmentieri]AYH09940.1 phenazine biosynthesis protein [Pectobacterium parmentieri]AYH19349.1 phenazine biosynthesis protein [Pectobacterium parmentieri]